MTRTDTQPEQRLTTADIARPKRADGPQPPAAAPLTGDQNPAAEQLHALFTPDVVNEFRGRWKEIQVGFVDEPRLSVQRADELVAHAIQRLAETFSDERSHLESQWTRGGDVSTEDLRVALQRYRTFFDRLLSI